MDKKKNMSDIPKCCWDAANEIHRTRLHSMAESQPERIIAKHHHGEPPPEVSNAVGTGEGIFGTTPPEPPPDEKQMAERIRRLVAVVNNMLALDLLDGTDDVAAIAACDDARQALAAEQAGGAHE